ncbi:MAG: Unknown protein [uncultured Sulfurovum sp.]|uniref:Lipoprotein n=1 Tax=uncultured Sulfurovum sp. TaxID=269237 RepID=A0A6S6T7J8_9BACT|nr:MAG: Unknown protein [uncultured Sulfurovum sp.]
MIKKTIMSLAIIILLSFVSCGGSSSKEAKELLQKILQFIGIPQSIVVQVCQDANSNGICNLDEIRTKVSVNENDSAEDILEKISLTTDGKYFMTTYTPELPILVELQDATKVNYDEGKFTLVFNGFKTKEDDNETKEISILASMVDANALSENIADRYRNLNNQEAQDKYYVALLDTLESNINILRAQGLDSQTAVRAAIKEMGEESRINENQVNKINTCANDQACVDREIKILADELLITDEERIFIMEDIQTPVKDINEETNTFDLVGKWKVTDPSLDINEWNPTVTISDDLSCTYTHSEYDMIEQQQCNVSLNRTFFIFTADEGESEFSGDATGSTSYFCIDGHYADGQTGTNCWTKI